jgi:hypothetical protein
MHHIKSNGEKKETSCNPQGVHIDAKYVKYQAPGNCKKKGNYASQ